MILLFYKSIRKFSSIYEGKQLLLSLETLINDLRTTNSINKKIEMIKKKPELCSLLKIIYAPEIRFHIKSTSINKYEPLEAENDASFKSIEELLKQLSDRILTGKAASQAVSAYVKENCGHEELIKCIIDKNLKARVGYELVKKAFPESTEDTFKIPVSLGYPIEKHLESLKKSIDTGEKWFISRKYDGIRTILVYDITDKSVKVLTRHLKPIFGLNPNITSALKLSIESKIIKDSIILDGEIVYIDSQGKENFSKTINLVKSMEPKGIEGLEFRVFDLINEDLQIVFSERLKKLREYISDPSPSDIIKLVDQSECDRKFDHKEYLKKAVELEYEGFILRKDCELKDGRSKKLLKIKPFLDDEFKVIDYEIGPMRLLDEFTKVETTQNVLLSITVNFNGHSVNVGSGFSNSERLEFAKAPENIMGKIVTIRYQSESYAEGRECKSMRFPVFKTLHGDNRSE